MDENCVFLANNILNELLESSSSSEDEEEMASVFARNVKPRVENFVENVIHVYTDCDFKKNLRISRESATILMERYSLINCKRSYQGGRQEISEETQILSFLWLSGNKTTLREVANLFDMSLSCTHRCINKVLTFLVEDVAPGVIKFPETSEEKEAVAKEFEKISGFPNVLGCIDGSYISVTTPKHKILSTYANRRDCVSITMQGICDSKLRFLDVFTGVTSKVHDSRIFKLSFISNKLPTICSQKYHLLGDAAYSLREYLLTPYRGGEKLTEAEKNYNLKFCQTRVKIENAFGVLKCRFRQLMRLDFQNVDTMAKFIIACCVLHNMCIDREDFYDEEIINTEAEVHIAPLEEDRRDTLLTQLGQIKRNKIKNRLFN